jgi:hypothetical protein
VTPTGGGGGSSPRDGTASNGPWFTCLPDCETSVPCGTGRHTVRWEAGSLRLASHPDAEGELVLAALGGERARCVELAEAWARHTGDLSVLAIWPRGPDDEITIGWDDVIAAGQPGLGPRPAPAPGRIGAPQSSPLAGPQAGPQASPPAGRPGAAMARAAARQRQVQNEMLAAQRHRDDLLSLLALGYGFQVRLIGQVAAAHAGPASTSQDGASQHGASQHGASQDGAGQDGASQGARPALVAAIAGRLAPVAEQWLGIDPDQVVVTLHHGPGWGSAELSGRESGRRLRVSLPTGWLASVWACGLALTGRHLVVAVEQPGWPHARVLGLRAPGAEPELLDVHAGPGGPGDVPHWEV